MIHRMFKYAALCCAILGMLALVGCQDLLDELAGKKPEENKSADSTASAVVEENDQTAVGMGWIWALRRG